MSEHQDIAHLLTRTGIGLPRGVLGPQARAVARLVAFGREDSAVWADARVEHWESFRLAIGAALARVHDDDPALAAALRHVDDPSPDNPLSQAVTDDAVRAYAASLLRTHERLEVLDQRLVADGGGDDLTRTVGDIVIDLLDLDPQDYEDEIADFLRVGDSPASVAKLARDTGDDEVRRWAREELTAALDEAEGTAAGALGRLAAAPPAEDPAEDPVWVAAIRALVDEAVEIASVDQLLDGGEVR
jgi:hypothetical protein